MADEHSTNKAKDIPGTFGGADEGLMIRVKSIRETSKEEGATLMNRVRDTAETSNSVARQREVVHEAGHTGTTAIHRFW